MGEYRGVEWGSIHGVLQQRPVGLNGLRFGKRLALAVPEPRDSGRKRCFLFFPLDSCCFFCGSHFFVPEVFVDLGGFSVVIVVSSVLLGKQWAVWGLGSALIGVHGPGRWVCEKNILNNCV